MNIIFMGTPDFAVPCLQKLHDMGQNVVGVFSQPDKPKGRHGVLTAPPVKQLALSLGYSVFQPASLKTGEAADIISSLNPDLIVVTAYGKILPGNILEMPKFGCVNIHASLLPNLRGAAPIQWSIINGLSVTGVTAMQMDEGLDTGDIILQKECVIDIDDNSETLFEKLSVLGAKALEDAIHLIERGEVKRKKQDDKNSSYAPVLSKDNSIIDWSLTALQVHNLIRGLNPWPGAVSFIDGKKIKIIKACLSQAAGGKPGQIMEKNKKLVVSCGDGQCIEILSIQPENKKVMETSAFLNGTSFTDGCFQN
ncbi:MAG: methionyl-tRNA formyltransferase [Clostridiales bacterium]|nr:methionyl-tRNA formyltransferase [Clostridiales bacterium]